MRRARARPGAAWGAFAVVPWGPTHGRGRVRSGVVGPGSGRLQRAGGGPTGPERSCRRKSYSNTTGGAGRYSDTGRGTAVCAHSPYNGNASISSQVACCRVPSRIRLRKLSSGMQSHNHLKLRHPRLNSADNSLPQRPASQSTQRPSAAVEVLHVRRHRSAAYPRLALTGKPASTPWARKALARAGTRARTPWARVETYEDPTVTTLNASAGMPWGMGRRCEGDGMGIER